jgi:hypothetical protein
MNTYLHFYGGPIGCWLTVLMVLVLVWTYLANDNKTHR